MAAGEETWHHSAAGNTRKVKFHFTGDKPSVARTARVNIAIERAGPGRRISA